MNCFCTTLGKCWSKLFHRYQVLVLNVALHEINRQQQQQTAQEKQQPGGSGPAVGRGVAGAPGRLGGAVSRPGLTGTGNATSGAAAASNAHAAARQAQAPLPRSALAAAGSAAAPAAPPTKREPLPVAAKDELSASLAARSVRDSHLRPATLAAATALASNNPFAVGLFGDSSSSPSASSQLASNSKVAARPEPQAGPRSKAFASGPAPATTPAAAPGAAGSSDTSFGAARPVNSRLEVSLGRSARPSPSSPLMQGTTEAAQPTSGVARSAPPAPVVAVKAQVPAAPVAPAPAAELSAVLSQDLEEVVAAPAVSISPSTSSGASPSPSSSLADCAASTSSGTGSAQTVQPPGRRAAPEVGVLALALAGLAKEQLVTSLGSGSNNSSRDEDDGAEGGSRRGRRVAAGGPLRTPDTQAPGLTRLMRRPTGSPPVSPAAKQDTAVVL